MQTLTTSQLKEVWNRQADVPVINVLPHEAYEKAHIAGTSNIPGDDEDFIERVEQAAGGKEQPVVVYCASEQCDASPNAAKRLEEAGFTHVYDYEGGTKAWEQAGEPVEGAQAARR
jgi:rhodanese-related sulfurtransferase